MLLLLGVKDTYLMVGIPKKRGIKYTSSKNYKKHKIICSLGKKYKVNTNYFVPIGMKCNSLSDYEPYWGNLKIIKMKKGSFYYNYTLSNEKMITSILVLVIMH